MTSSSSSGDRKTGPSRKKVLRELLDAARGFKLTPEHYTSTAEIIWENLDTPRSLACALLLKYGEYAQLVNLGCDPRSYISEWDSPYSARSGRQFRDDYQATALLAKWPNFVHEDLDPRLACEKADSDAEQACVASNRRLRKAFDAPIGHPAYLHRIFSMQADISRVLGPFCPEKWETSCAFGPGKALGQEGKSVYDKLTALPSVTVDFLPLGASLISGSVPWLEAVANAGVDPETPSWDIEGETYRFSCSLQPGDRCQTVPKNAKTLRGIRAQPGLNVYAQLGIGRMMRERLQAFGLDLNDQTPNQSLAKLGSLPGRKEVTIDLKGASGHICSVLVRTLFERAPRWLHAMELCRTDRYLPHGVEDVRDNYVPLASFSAMGNGYTFELETLIFWAAVRVIRRELGERTPYRVYGDDIICSQDIAKELIPFLSFLGFPINASKTFTEGPFRESCGADYWLGTNIRPVYFSIDSEEIEEANNDGTSLLRWVSLCNSIRKVARLRNHGLGCDAVLRAAWVGAIRKIPRRLRESLKTPWDDFRDDSLITDWDDAVTNPLVRACGSLQALVAPRLSLVQLPGSLNTSFLGAKAAMLYKALDKDRAAVRYDRTRSWLRSFLQKQSLTPLTPLQQAIHKAIHGTKHLSVGGGDVRPSGRYGLSAGWEVFHPVGDYTAWC